MVRSGYSLVQESMSFIWKNKQLIFIPIVFFAIPASIFLGVARLCDYLLGAYSETIATGIMILVSGIFFMAQTDYFLKVARNQYVTVLGAIGNAFRTIVYNWWYILFFSMSAFMPGKLPVPEETFFIMTFRVCFILIYWIALYFIQYLLLDGANSFVAVMRSCFNFFMRGWRSYLGIVFYIFGSYLAYLILFKLFLGIPVGWSMYAYVKSALLDQTKLFALGAFFAPAVLFLLVSFGLAVTYLYIDLNEEDAPELYTGW